MKKKLYSVFVLLLLFVSILPMSVNAETATSGLWYTLNWSFDETTATLTIGGKGPILNGDLPWEALGKSVENIVIEDGVTEIPNNTFYDLNNVKKISLSNTVLTIGSNAFRGPFKEVAIPVSVVEIGEGAFYSTKGYTETVTVFYPGTEAQWNRISLDEKYGGGTIHFNSTTCTNTYDVRQKVAATCTESGLTQGTYCPTCNTVFTEQTVVPAVGHYEYIPYEGKGYEPTCTKTGLTDKIVCDRYTCNLVLQEQEVIPAKGHSYSGGYCTACGDIDLNTVTAPGPYGACGEYATWIYDESNQVLTIKGTGEVTEAPWKSYTIKKLVVEEGITILPNSSFEGCASLTDVTIADTVTKIGAYTFHNCTGLKNVKLSNSLTELNYYLFMGCTALEKVEIPDSVYQIGHETFRDCSQLTEIHIPANLERILLRAFQNCEKLEKFTVDEDNPYFCTDDRGVIYSKDMSELVTVPGGLSGSYKIADTVTAVHEFEYCNQLTEVYIPAGVEGLSMSIFYQCPELKMIRVDENNFNYCADENGVLFDKNKTTIYHVPQKLSGNYVVPNSVNKITEGYSFQGCDSITALYIPFSVKKIGDLFWDCASLKDIYYAGNERQWVRALNYPYDTEVDYTVHFNCKDFSSCKHKEVVDAAVQPSCTAEGKTEGSHCVKCGVIIKAQDPIPATGHNYVNGKCDHCGGVDSNVRLRGDVDGNGKVNSDDAIYLLRHTMNPVKYPLH